MISIPQESLATTNAEAIQAYCSHLREKAKDTPDGCNPFKSTIEMYGGQYSNSVTLDEEHRKEIPLLILELFNDEIIFVDTQHNVVNLIQSERGNLISINSEKQSRWRRLGVDTSIFLIKEDIKSNLSRIHLAYDLCHYFANIAQNCQHLSDAEYVEHVLYFLSVDKKHLPSESVGFNTVECAKELGGLYNWILLRDIIFELYLPKRDEFTQVKEEE